MNNAYQQPDAELVRSCLQGDDQAWAVLLDRYGDLIYSIARTSDLPSQDAADVFQSVCLSLMKHLEQLQHERALSAWLTETTLRHCQQLLNLDSSDGGPLELPDDSPLPREVLRGLERERLIRQAIAMLDEPCRQVLLDALHEDEVWNRDEFVIRSGSSVSTEPNLRCCLEELSENLNRLGF
jgi:RNA polymerase sigma factor (sigma-70 family)